MKSKIFSLLLITFGSSLMLVGCYTQLSPREWSSYSRNKKIVKVEKTEEYQNESDADTVVVEDDNNTIVNNYYYDDRYPTPRRFFRGYYPSFGFSMSYGHLYDPFYGDPWWDSDYGYGYSPYLIYNPYWGHSYWGGYGGWGGGIYYASGNHSSYSNPYKFRKRGDVKLREGGSGRGSSLVARDLTRISTPNRVRESVKNTTELIGRGRPSGGRTVLGSGATTKTYTNRENGGIPVRKNDGTKTRIIEGGSATTSRGTVVQEGTKEIGRGTAVTKESKQRIKLERRSTTDGKEKVKSSERRSAVSESQRGQSRENSSAGRSERQRVTRESSPSNSGSVSRTPQRESGQKSSAPAKSDGGNNRGSSDNKSKNRER